MTDRKYLEVLTPANSQIIFIDQQPQMAHCWSAAP